MQVLTTFLPGATKKIYALGSSNGSLLDVYVEAATPKGALIRYAALPTGLRGGDASFAVEVTTDAYVAGKKVFYTGFFEALGIV